MYSYDEIMQFVYIIVEVANPDRVILFGSYAYGNPSETSDLDILVIKNDEVLSRDERAELALEIFDKRMQRQMKMRYDLFIRTDKEVVETAETGGAFVDAMLKGRVVYERASY